MQFPTFFHHFSIVAILRSLKTKVILRSNFSLLYWSIRKRLVVLTTGTVATTEFKVIKFVPFLSVSSTSIF
ncbi:unnamed protein product [Haemonchus placei]|uniref:Secreted protein n=1 Tax=Haemonchus placei TaxID=6290 RepID=A0A0N4X695_HAEPC|nr:unnamed protein product [Haemonchus placei]